MGAQASAKWSFTSALPTRFGLKRAISAEYASLFASPVPGEPRPKLDFLVAAAGANIQ